MNVLQILLIVSFLFLSLVFSACNYALRSFSRLRLEQALARVGRLERLDGMLRRLPSLVLAAATMRMLANILLILGLAHYLHEHTDNYWLRLTVVGAVAFVTMTVFSVAAPTAWANYAGEALLARMLPMLEALRVLLGPLLTVLHALDEVIRRLAGQPRKRPDDEEEEIEREILHAVSEGEREGVVDPAEKAMIESVLGLEDSRVAQIMTPRLDIVAVEASADLATCVELLRRSGHSRIPVYESNLDNVIGILYVKDLLLHVAGRGGQQAGPDAPFSVRKIMRPPMFVPESKSPSDLLADLKREQVHIAIVLDEFGGTAGLVTIEDVLEEIVGDIGDEHAPPEPVMARRVNETTLELDGRARVDDVNRDFDLQLPEGEDYETVSGFVISELGRIPKAGEKLVREPLTITVAEAEPRRILRLRIERARAATGEAAG